MTTPDPVVGRLFFFDGAHYRCLYHNDCGYQMRVEAIPDLTAFRIFAERGIGAETNVSERAIGRTYHELPEPRP